MTDSNEPNGVKNVKTPNQIGGDETMKAGANIVTPDLDAGTKPIEAGEGIPIVPSTEATGTVITLVDISTLTARESHYYREQLDEANVEDCRVAYFENEAAMRRGEEPVHDIPPIKVWCDPDTGEFVVLGGNHRTAGATLAGLTTIPAIVYHCSSDEAYIIGLRDNSTHGLKPNKGDLKHIIKKALERFPKQSLRWIVEQSKCSLTRVSEVANELYDSGQLKRPEKRIGKDGKEYTVSRRGRKKKPSADALPEVPKADEALEGSEEEPQRYLERLSEVLQRLDQTLNEVPKSLSKQDHDEVLWKVSNLLKRQRRYYRAAVAQEAFHAKQNTESECS